MTVDELVDEYNKHCDNPYSPIDIRAGVRAVVARLRNEARDNWAYADNMFNEILGDAGAEKVAGGVAVCEWARHDASHWWAGCHAGMGPMLASYHTDKKQTCPVCYRLIKFTEVK